VRPGASPHLPLNPALLMRGKTRPAPPARSDSRPCRRSIRTLTASPRFRPRFSARSNPCPLRPVRRPNLGRHPHRPLPQVRRIPAHMSNDPDPPNLGSLRTRRLAHSVSDLGHRSVAGHTILQQTVILTPASSE
jgi:hypothetical protein